MPYNYYKILSCLVLQPMHRLPTVVECAIDIYVPTGGICTIFRRSSTYDTGWRAFTIDEVAR